MSIRKEIFSNCEIMINGKPYREIKILGIRIRIKLKKTYLERLVVEPKYKIKSRYLTTMEPAGEFRLEDKNELYEIFLNSSEGTMHKLHHYFPIYYNHFARFKNRPVNILEIGVCQGGSVKMWKKFFGGGEVNIYGVDIDPECKKFEAPEEGLYIKIADQSNREDLRKLMKELPKIDIVIDDGGHTTNQQITTFEEIYDKISDDGVYLVEDLHTNYYKDFLDSKNTFIEFAKSHIDALNAWYKSRNYNLGYELQLENKNITVPQFTNITHGIHFYPSIIVFEKKKMCVPFAEHR